MKVTTTSCANQSEDSTRLITRGNIPASLF
uniref:Uncharacterized protein n=1 Tax=Anguilla anguilla TaxID=7936 RepID=A0A0E9V3N8_ANGAN